MKGSPVWERAYAKLTLDLHVTGRTADGYHTLESEMVTVSLFDEVALIDRPGVEVEDPTGRASELEALHGPIPRDGRNIALRALRRCGGSDGVALRKSIPFMAGLGGGSADAAAVMRLMGRSGDVALARELGSDVPFCLLGGRARVSGSGEVLTPLPFVAGEWTLFLLPVAIPTAAVYRRYDEVGADGGANDLLRAARSVSPSFAAVMDAISERFGRERVRMAGSGSTLFIPGDVGQEFEEARGGRDGRRWIETEGLAVELISVRATPATTDQKVD